MRRPEAPERQARLGVARRATGLACDEGPEETVTEPIQDRLQPRRPRHRRDEPRRGPTTEEGP